MYSHRVHIQNLPNCAGNTVAMTGQQGNAPPERSAAAQNKRAATLRHDTIPGIVKHAFITPVRVVQTTVLLPGQCGRRDAVLRTVATEDWPSTRQLGIHGCPMLRRGTCVHVHPNAAIDTDVNRLSLSFRSSKVRGSRGRRD